MHDTTSYKLPELPYDFNALEPVISKEIMELHYTKHHKAYVDNLNKALEKYHEAETKNDVAAMIAMQQAIKFNGGGHINHSIFWTILASPSKGGGEGPKNDLLKQIEEDFNSFENFKEKFNSITVAIQGSGWGWLGFNKESRRLEIATTSNQDPLSSQKLIPLLGVDVWEHAYYLQYKNMRADYVKAIWQIFNWKQIEDRYAKAIV